MTRVFLFASMMISLCGLADRRADSLQDALSRRAADTTLVKDYTQLAWNYFNTADTAKAVSCLRTGTALSEKLGFGNGLLASYSNLAMLYTAYGKIDSSLHYLSLCLEKARLLHNSPVASKCCANMASAYLNQANYEQAIRYYIEALKYFDNQKDQAKIAMTEHCIGIAYDLMKNYPLSLSYYRKAIAACGQLGKPESAGYSYNGIGVVYKELGRYDSSLYYLDKSYALAELAGDKTLLSHTLSSLGEIEGMRHEDAKAMGYLLEALAMQKELNDYRGIAEGQILVGNLLLRQKEFSGARDRYASARDIALQTGLSDILKNAWKGLSDAYKGLHDYPMSLEAYRHYSDIKDSLYTAESTRQIADMQTKYNTEKKEQENMLLQQEGAIKDLQLSKEKSQKYILVILFVFAILLGLVYYNRYRLQQKNKLLKERELRTQAVFQAQENEKAKLSKDLHDGVGALLSLIKLNISGIVAEGEQEKIVLGTKDLASKAMKEVRNVSHSLMPSLLARAGLIAAIGDMVEQVNAAGDVQLQFEHHISISIRPEAELGIFRMIQEAVNNMIKYATAGQGLVSLQQNGGSVIVLIKDDGCGFDKSALDSVSGNGLNNISSRAALLKGYMDLDTAPGQGTRMTIHFPLTSLAYD